MSFKQVELRENREKSEMPHRIADLTEKGEIELKKNIPVGGSCSKIGGGSSRGTSRNEALLSPQQLEVN